MTLGRFWRLALGSDAFAELAQIVTLRKFHAGQCSFDIRPRMPLTRLLKAHPSDLSGFLGELCFGVRGVGPVVEPHINYWRANQMVLLKREHERAIWRIAQFVEEHPAIKALISSSWLYAVETGNESPHLGWLREFYALENARTHRRRTGACGRWLPGRQRAAATATPSVHARRSCCGLVRTYWPGRIATLNAPTAPASAPLRRRPKALSLRVSGNPAAAAGEAVDGR